MELTPALSILGGSGADGTPALDTHFNSLLNLLRNKNTSLHIKHFTPKTSSKVIVFETTSKSFKTFGLQSHQQP